MEITWKFTEALIFTDDMEDAARFFVENLCGHPAWEGSVLWRSTRNPYRPGHKRSNWFVGNQRK